MNDGVPSKSPRDGAAPTAAAPAGAPATTSTPRFFNARRILIGSIAVPSYSPGIGKDVTIKTRIVEPPVLKDQGPQA